MGKVKQSIIDTEEEFSDLNEETCEEGAFHFFIQDLNHYAKSGVYGPLIWKEVAEETREIIKNIVRLDDMGCDNIHEWKPA